ncbi:hypothetical protein BBP40_002921 [Aspergillus hancockii]|nr:hypothetical protein BBP40_002921 [Aspergillus hancockii]
MALATAEAEDENEITTEEAAACRPGFRRCIESCRRNNGGNRCYNVDVAAP